MFRVICFVAALALSNAIFGGDVAEMFRERAKCTVSVKYSIQLEENRRQISTTAMVASPDGLIVVPASEIPLELRHDELADFKVYAFGGDVDGYPAKYLGADVLTGTHFLKIDGGLPKEMSAYTKFGRAKASVCGRVWGIGISNEALLFEPYYMESYVSYVGRRPLLRAQTGGTVAAIGAPVFDSNGDFVGWADSQAGENLLLYAGKLNGAPISLVSPFLSNSFMFPEELDAVLKRVPSNPQGDKYGWLGLVGTKVLKREVAKMMGITGKSALLVSEIVKNSAAEKAGLKKGDIIVAVDGKPIAENGEEFVLYDFRSKFALKKAGEKIVFSVVRGADEPRDFTLSVGESPKTYRQARTKYFKKIGFSVRDCLVDDAFARKNFSADMDAAVVKYVKPNSPAASAMPSALAVGDLIKEVNSKPVSSYTEAVDEISKLAADGKTKEIVILAEDLKETKVVRIKLD